jgi:archaeal flagellin FlaB
MISYKNNYEGFTGLEAAIVLIAFVVVAAVFSYVVLGAGFFTTQKSQEVVHTGVQQASSTLEIVGNVYGTSASTGGTGAIDTINFSIALAPGGTPVDISKMTIVYSNATQAETLGRTPIVALTNVAGNWSVVRIQNDQGSSNWLLEKGETFEIGAMPSRLVYKNDNVALELRPIVGASLGIKRSTPAAIDAINILY